MACLAWDRPAHRCGLLGPAPGRRCHIHVRCNANHLVRMVPTSFCAGFKQGLSVCSVAPFVLCCVRAFGSPGFTHCLPRGTRAGFPNKQTNQQPNNSMLYRFRTNFCCGIILCIYLPERRCYRTRFCALVQICARSVASAGPR